MRSLPLILLVTVLQSPVAWSAAEPYGKRYLAVSDLLPLDGRSPGMLERRVVAGEDPELAGAESALRERLARQEVEAGPYAPVLAETLSDLARLLSARGDEEGAQRLRERALHLVRVNEGLYSHRQGPLVRSMLDSLRRREAFGALDDRYAYFYRLYGGGRPPFDEVRWAATLEFLAWQREALLREIDGDPRQRLIDLHRANEDLLAALRESTETDWRQLRDATLSLLATLYLVEDMVEPEETLDPRYDAILRRRRDPQDFDMLRERLATLQRTAFSQGRRGLEEAIAAAPVQETAGRLELHLALADWLQWHGAEREAGKAYETVWVEADAAGLGDSLERWFAAPVPLPASGVFEVAGTAATEALPVTLRVSDDGRARVLDAAVAEDRQRDLGRLRRHLHATRFRPAMRDGRAVEFPDLRQRWVLLED